jgi:hypothetical protein
MTATRHFISGTTYFITRRCTQRQFWLKPTPFVEHPDLPLLPRCSRGEDGRTHPRGVRNVESLSYISDRSGNANPRILRMAAQVRGQGGQCLPWPLGESLVFGKDKCNPPL